MEYTGFAMWTTETTRSWDESSHAISEANPDHMGFLWASLRNYWALLNACNGRNRPQMEGLTEEDMGIISLREMAGPTPGILLAYVFPDEEKRLALLIKVGTDVDKNADMEYVKRCVAAYMN